MLSSESSGELLLVFGTVFLATYWLYQRRNASADSQKTPPSFTSLPVVGSLPFMPFKMEDLAAFCISPKNKLGRVFSFHAGSKRVVVISGRDTIHEALVTKSVEFADRPEFYIKTVVNPDMKGIASSPYTEAFKTQHKLCLSILKRFGFGQRVMETRILMEVEEMIQKLREQEGRPFDVKQLTTSSVANVIMNMLFGHRFDHEDAEFQRLVSDISGAFAEFSLFIEVFPVLRILPYFRKKAAEMVARFNAVDGRIDKDIAACQQAKTESFVNYYIESEGPDYDKEQLFCTIRDLAAAGMETTATTLRWAVVLLTNHVAVQDRLHQEIDSVIGRDRLPALDDRPNLPYVEATILEIMRNKTLLPFAARSTLQDTDVDGYFIPSGTMVLVSLHSVHMDPAVWDEPDQFRPERFLDESGNVVGRERIMPFSLGKRSCLGEQLARQEIFLFFVSLLQNFNFRPPEGQERLEVHEVWGETNSPSAFKVCMVPREQQ